VRLILVSVVVLVVLLSPHQAGDSSIHDSAERADASGPSPSAGTFPAWRDDFNDTSKVGLSSGVQFTGQDVRLPPGNATRKGPVLLPGPGWDTDVVGPWSVIHEGAIYKMWHNGCTGSFCQGGYATSTDGVSWTKFGVVLPPTLPQEGGYISYGDVIKVGAQYWMFYTGSDGTFRLFAANSTDGITWTKHGVVLSPGPPGSPDDYIVWRPSVVYSSGTFYMWYGGSSNSRPSYHFVFLAVSTDGLSWTKQGVVLSPGPPGSLDDESVPMPSVRLMAGTFHMAYTGYHGGVGRLFYADSVDGVSWRKLGIALDVRSPDESQVIHPALLIEANGSRSLYYASRPPSWAVYLAVRPPPGPLSGWVRSVAVTLPIGLRWGWFNETVSVPTNDSVNVTVHSAQSFAPISGYENRTAGPLDLGGLDPTQYSSLVFEGWLHGNDMSTPILDSWEVSWTDSAPPIFAGIESATDLGTGGSVHLAWSAGSDPSNPLTYSVYQARASVPFDFGVANYTTLGGSLNVSGLINGVLYGFLVRATDAWGNRDANIATRSVIPTTPIDSTPPNFAGLQSAVDARVGGQVLLSWTAAVDPDTPASNSDPSLPITYLVYVATSAGNFDFGSPVLVTGSITARVDNLTDGTGYQFVVRARDARGNVEANANLRRATPTHSYDSTPPIFAGVLSTTDLGTGDRVRVAWEAGTDPDTPESNSDPSLPLTYSIFVSENSSALGSGPPLARTNATSIDLAGLRPGTTYYVLVRATDAAGNRESNSRIVEFQLRAAPVAPYWWIVALLIILVVIVVALVAWRRKAKQLPPTTPFPP